jgi:hypothetical protein
MADRISFGLQDVNGAPLTGATPSFVQYRTTTGGSPTPPAITELGGGQYGFTPSDSDESTRVAFLIDCGVGSVPRRYAGAIHTPNNPFLAWHLENVAGDLWVGANPSVGIWRDFSGVARTPPSVLAIGGTSYLFAVVPSTADLKVDVAFRLDSPAGAFPEYLTGSVESQPWIAPSPGPLKDAAADVAAFLNGKAASSLTMTEGTNLFIGQMRAIDRTPAPGVFVLGTGGPSPSAYIGGHRTALFTPTVQVMVRGPAGDDTEGAAIAGAIYAWLHQQVPVGYVSWDARDSAPVYLGDDGKQHGLWVINLECAYRSSLG